MTLTVTSTLLYCNITHIVFTDVHLEIKKQDKDNYFYNQINVAKFFIKAINQAPYIGNLISFDVNKEKKNGAIFSFQVFVLKM